jgi:hypothetical protein
MRLLQRLILIIAGCAFAIAALAQLRSIPDEAKRGVMRHVYDMVVEIDGTSKRLAPSAQIRDPSNRIVVPTALPAGSQVKYLLNAEGLVRQVWILSPAEAAKP